MLVNNINVNESLMPETASGFGYRWVRDIAYDPDAPVEAMQDVFEAIKDGCVLGQPAALSLPETFYGLYEPVKK